MGTIHIESAKEDIAEIVLMPGDPLRASYIAKSFLSDCKEVNALRGMLAYTGYYKGQRVTVFASGMGIPSVGIYSYELFKFYDVKKIIRIGTCGSNKEEVKVGDIIIADAAYSESSFGTIIDPGTPKTIKANEELTDKLYQTALKNNTRVKKGLIYTSDVFDVYFDIKRILEGKDLLASEMEAYGLFFIANYLNKEAAAILTVVDSKYENNVIPPKDREKALNEMISLALESII